MATTVVYQIAVSGDDRSTQGTGTSYPPGYSSTQTTDLQIYAAKSQEGGTHIIRNGLLRWNTSNLPDDATITAASITVVMAVKYNDSERNLCVGSYAWNGTSSDYDSSSAPSSNIAKISLDSIPNTGAWTFNVSSANLGFVNKTGNTSVRMSIDGGKPASGTQTAYNDVRFYSWNNYASGSPNSPRLTVVYETMTEYVGMLPI